MRPNKKNNLLHKFAKKIECLVKDEYDREVETTSPLIDACKNPEVVKDVIFMAAEKMHFEIMNSDQTEDGSIFRMLFKYQDAAFLLDLYYSTPCRIQLTFPNFLAVDPELINEVRATCNHFNTNCLTNFVTYEMDEKENELTISLLRNLTPTLSAEDMNYQLQESLAGFFSMARHFTSDYDDISKAKKREKVDDIEHTYHCSKRLEALLAEDELRHHLIKEGCADEPSLSSRAQCLLGTWLERNQLLLGDVTLDKLSVSNDQGYSATLTEEQAIKDFFLLSPILYQANGTDEVTVQNATLSLTYHHKAESEEGEARSKVLMLLLENAATIDHTLYVRISYLVPERRAKNTSRFAPMVFTNHTTGSIVIGYDWKDERSKHSEFEYMWQEVQDKLAGKNNEPLTPEQKSLINVTQPQLGFCCYWGKKLLLRKRYYEAIYHLELAWNMQNNRYYELDQKGVAIYDELCFLLALCYNKLGYPRNALFYINNLEEIKSERYIKEEASAMIRARQHDAALWIEKGLENLRNHIDDLCYNEQELDDETSDLYNFMRRQYVVAHVEMQQLSKAEEECKRMIDDNEQTEFAHEELRYIRNLREKGVNDINSIANKHL